MIRNLAVNTGIMAVGAMLAATLSYISPVLGLVGVFLTLFYILDREFDRR